MQQALRAVQSLMPPALPQQPLPRGVSSLSFGTILIVSPYPFPILWAVPRVAKFLVVRQDFLARLEGIADTGPLTLMLLLFKLFLGLG